jgi:hypothetical protein
MLKHAIQIRDEGLDYSSVRNIIELPSFPIDAALDSSGMTSLMFACYLGKLSIINLLLKHGANPHVLDKILDNCVVYALRGYRSNILEVLQLLYQYDANFFYKNSKGKSPIDMLKDYKARDFEDFEELRELLHEFAYRFYSRGSLMKMHYNTRLELV